MIGFTTSQHISEDEENVELDDAEDQISPKKLIPLSSTMGRKSDLGGTDSTLHERLKRLK